MSETFVVTKQQKERLTTFLEEVDREITLDKESAKDVATILGLGNEDVESSVATYLSSSGIEKLFYLINGKSKFRNEAFNLIAIFCHNPKNHSLLIKLGILNEFFKEVEYINSPVIVSCVSALADLTNVPENRDILRSNSCIKHLVPVLNNPNAASQKEIVIGIIASLCINKETFINDLIKSGIFKTISKILNEALEKQKIFDECNDEENEKSEKVKTSADDPIFVNCLWICATASYSQVSHLFLLKEGIINILVKIIKQSQSPTYCDYSLSTLLQLSATEECRKAMVELGCHTILLQKASTGTPSVVRRSLQVLANLCVDEDSRKLISEMPNVLQTVPEMVDKIEFFRLAGAGAGAGDGGSEKRARIDKLDMRSLLQGLKFFSNLVQSDVESTLFRENGCIEWLVKMAGKFQEVSLEPVVEQQIAHLSANILIYGENHARWVEAGGLTPLKMMLGKDKHLAIQKESARAISNLFAYYDNIRIKGYENDIVSALIDCLKRSYPLRSETAQLQLFIFRSLASLAFSYQKIGMLVNDDVIRTTTEAVCEVTEAELKSDEISGVLLLYLNFITTLLGNFNIDAKGEELCEITPQELRIPDMRVLISTHKKVGIFWLAKLIQIDDRSIQLQTLKLLIQLVTSWKARELIKADNIDILTPLSTLLKKDATNIYKHFQNYVMKYTGLLDFPHDMPEQKELEKEKEKDPENEKEREKEEQQSSRENAMAMRRNRRVRHKALKLTQDQVEAISEGTGPEENTPVRITTLRRFVASEHKYIAMLTRALWMYFKPLYGLPPNPPKGLISSGSLRAVFSPMEQIVSLCSTFVDVIEARKCENNASVGDALDAFAKRFSVYADYSGSLQGSLDALTCAQAQAPRLKAFVESVDSNPLCQGKTLRNILELPMEHVASYITLLKELKISTHESHPDTPHIQSALESISTQVLKIKKHEKTREQILLGIDARFKGLKESFAEKPERLFICETRAQLLQIGSKTLEEEIESVIFLFSDMFVVAKVTNKGMCKMLDSIPLTEIIAGNVNDFPKRFKIQRNSTNSSFQSGYTFSLPSVREQKLLLDTILEAQTALTTKTIKRKIQSNFF